MGEYAIRKSDNQEVKIGTCQSMYYIRYEDRTKVTKLDSSLDAATTTDLFWRLPFPDEDNVRIGEYEEFNRGFRLYKSIPNEPCENFTFNEIDETPGIIQLSHKCGLLVNVPCFHGAKLPNPPPGGQIFWNGKSWFLELTSIKNTKEGKIRFVVSCIHCRHMWSYTWDEIQEWIPAGEMRSRLEMYLV